MGVGGSPVAWPAAAVLAFAVALWMRSAGRGGSEDEVEDVDEAEDEEEVVVLGDAGCAVMRAVAGLWAAASLAATARRMEGMSSGCRLGGGGWGGPAVNWRPGRPIWSAAVKKGGAGLRSPPTGLRWAGVLQCVRLCGLASAGGTRFLFLPSPQIHPYLGPLLNGGHTLSLYFLTRHDLKSLLTLIGVPESTVTSFSARTRADQLPAPEDRSVRGEGALALSNAALPMASAEHDPPPAGSPPPLADVPLSPPAPPPQPFHRAAEPRPRPAHSHSLTVRSHNINKQAPEALIHSHLHKAWDISFYQELTRSPQLPFGWSPAAIQPKIFSSILPWGDQEARIVLSQRVSPYAFPI